MFAEHLTQEPFHSLDSDTWFEFSHRTELENFGDREQNACSCTSKKMPSLKKKRKFWGFFHDILAVEDQCIESLHAFLQDPAGVWQWLQSKK